MSIYGNKYPGNLLQVLCRRLPALNSSLEPMPHWLVRKPRGDFILDTDATSADPTGPAVVEAAVIVPAPWAHPVAEPALKVVVLRFMKENSGGAAEDHAVETAVGVLGSVSEHFAAN